MLKIFNKRIWDTLFRAALALAGTAVVQRLSTRVYAVLTWLLLTVWLGFYEFYGYPVYIALFLVLLSILMLLRIDSSTAPRRSMFLSGLFLGAAALFRHDFGVYAAAAELIVFTPLVLSGAIAMPGRRRFGGLITLLLPYLLGAALPVLPAVILILMAVPMETLWSDLVVFPTRLFPLVRALPYPELSQRLPANWPYYLPYLVLGVTAVYLVIRLLALPWRKLDTAHAVRLSGLAYLLVFAAASINQSRIRADLIHLVTLLVISFILLFSMAGYAWHAWKPAGAAALLVGLILLVPFYSLVVDERERLFERGIWANTPNTDHQIPAARWMPVDPNQAAAVRYVRQVLPENTPIYLATSRHDRIFVNDALFYFLAQRPSATQYHELHPGVATTQEVQDEIADNLEEQQVPLVVSFSMYENVAEPNDSGKSSGVRLLDTYLGQYYRLDQSFGPFYQVLVRKGG